MSMKKENKSGPKPTAIDVYKHWEQDKKLASSNEGSLMRQVILGGQDGLVNVLGLILGVAGATNDPKLIIIAGLAATAAESISMAAVAYTSSKAEMEHYQKEKKKEEWEIDHLPEVEREEIRLIYMRKGFRGKDLEVVTNRICSDRKLWLDTMMTEELGLSNVESIKPGSEAVVVGFSSVVGSLVPLVPFFLFTGTTAIAVSLGFSLLVLFGVGAYKGKITLGNWIKSGIEMAIIGFGAAMAGYAIGAYLGVNI
jgi:VIT1/CCC1 family predicted Fe2+/Mn2+ transporter